MKAWSRSWVEDEPRPALWRTAVGAASVAFVCGCSSPDSRSDARAAAASPAGERPLAGRPIVIAHRGASGHRPEHTLAAYDLAIQMGADFIEPDLVMTKDRVLIARHENEISETTDVAAKFPKRKRTRTVDGEKKTGWFAEDFTLAEIKRLRARERLASRSHAYDGQFEVASFAEIIELAQRRSRELGRTVGVYPETKHPTYHRSVGLALEPALARALAEQKWLEKDAPVIVQSFELSSLRELRKLGVRTRMILLMEAPTARPYDFVVAGDARTYGDFMRPEGLRELARDVDGIGPNKQTIVPPTGADGSLGPPTPLVRWAHQAGLFVHPWAFRSDAPFLPAAYAGDAGREYAQFFALGVDGVFSDFADDAAKARESWGR